MGYNKNKLWIYYNWIQSLFQQLVSIKNYKDKDVLGATTDNVEIYPIVPGFSYNIFVKAVTANGIVSNPTSINYTHPSAHPSASPSNIHASVQGTTSLTITWDALGVLTKNGDIWGYQGPGLTGTKRVTILGEDNRQYTITGLMPDSTYQFVVRVVNDVGAGPYSAFIPINTAPLLHIMQKK
ncbi:unnamed protein product [Mytilus edulis]|uniref:Fibronectin type-III domain-containing protein n=1 Tax=Mytilus edulis TaxID=6550 RepID=A0A8S3TKB3_MYTED|nr:unnamed protein product [Mytilus edulis]